MALHDIAGMQIGDKRAFIQFDVDEVADEVVAVVVTNQMPIELEVLSPTRVNVISRAVYPAGAFTTNIPKNRRFNFSAFDFSVNLSSRQ